MDARQRTAVIGATVIRGDGRPAIDDAVVLIADGRFTVVGRAADVPVPDDATVVDARGQFLIPGLIEGHAHLTSFVSAKYHPDTGAFGVVPPVMEAMLAHGITTIRDTGGPDIESFHALRQHSKPWPRLFGSGPNLESLPGGPWLGMWKTDNPNEAREFVRREADAGVDFVKVYVFMGAAVLSAVVDEAHSLGLPVAAHVGHALTVEEAVLLGVDALEHVRVGPELLSPEQLAQFRALPPRPMDELASLRFWRWAGADSPESDRVIKLMVDRGVVMTPTLVTFLRLMGIEDSLPVVNPASPLASDELISSLGGHVDGDGSPRSDASSAEDRRLARAEFESMCAFFSRAAQAGLTVVAGSDSPSLAIMPGQSLHDEMALLVRNGFSPAQAITAATATPARLLGRSHEIGTIDQGKFADLVLLSQDPRIDIEAIRSVRSVFVGGEQLVSARLSRA